MGHDSQWADVASSAGVDDASSNLTESGLFLASGVSRRIALKTGGVVGLAGLVALALPSPADAASSDPGVAFVKQAGTRTMTVGTSLQPRQIFFTLYGGGGNSGAWTSPSETSGGNAGFVTGSVTFPAGAETAFIIYPGFGGGPGYSAAGNGQTDVDGRSGNGGGAGAGGIQIAGITVVTVGAGGGGGGSVAAPGVPPRGGDGAGIGAGSPGTTSSAALPTGAGGGGGTTTAGGAAGTPPTTIAPFAGTGPAPTGGGGRGGRAAAGAPGASPGGGGGGGYYNGGGGTGSSTGVDQSGGGGSGYISGMTGNGSVRHRRCRLDHHELWRCDGWRPGRWRDSSPIRQRDKQHRNGRSSQHQHSRRIHAHLEAVETHTRV
ncbi:MAG: hypothetical protein JWM76_4467 [Pseudonocardiales bacterium]|nr:hypothetical protein [Pseudonocardiales bacterium]